MAITIDVEQRAYYHLIEQLKIIDRSVVEVGILSKEGSEMLMIATVNEFGTDIKVTPKMRGYLASQGLFLKSTTLEIKIPERSYIRLTADSKKSQISKFLDKRYDDLFEGKINANQFLDGLGEFLVGITRKTMVDVRTPSNHPFTLRRKAPKSNPLINSGDLLSRISYEVRKK